MDNVSTGFSMKGSNPLKVKVATLQLPQLSRKGDFRGISKNKNKFFLKRHVTSSNSHWFVNIMLMPQKKTIDPHVGSNTLSFFCSVQLQKNNKRVWLELL